MTGSERRTRGRVAAEAAEWFTAMQSGEVSGRDRAQFSQWLAHSREHVQEYLAVASLWRDLDATDDAQRSAEDLLAAARADDGAHNIVDLHARLVDLPFRFPPRKGRSEGLFSLKRVAAAFTLLTLGLAAGFLADRYLNGHRYSTGIGEQSSFVLADGSVIRLNTQSSMRVRLHADARDISLREGEAMFEVAKDPSRPFRVHAGNTVVEAVGTAFNVYRTSGETRVTVLEGQVRVIDSAAQGIELQARERARVSRKGVIVKDRVNLEQASAWTNRRLVFYTETLQTVVEEFNRYNVQHLQVTDPELAAMRISGNFSAADPKSLVQFLERTESATAAPGENGVIKLSRK